ncbi:MAG TPA: transketolase C-terminal domain-containing protein, partial [Thermoanaerobaculia bacterium]|nr:transketolase C-terminal domain-containing protein [Thermoanaerobaculia bacterium]
GYQLAEDDPVYWHGPAPFQVETGESAKKSAPPSYTAVFADALSEIAAKDPRVVGVTAAMSEGTGVDRFAKKFPERAFDVGICEQHAVLFAAGLATQGFRPVCAIYSTFLQRAYDQIMHDVCLMDLPVVFALDRAGVVGADGPTHHGVFDLTYLRVFPNMQVCAPKDENELRHLVATALASGHPTAIRYPRGAGYGVAMDPELKLLPVGKGEVLRVGKDGAVFAIGDPVVPAWKAAERLAKGGGPSLTVVNARWAKPLDRELLAQFVKAGTVVVTVEENQLAGGFGSAVVEALEEIGVTADVKRLGIPDRFVPQATQAQQRQGLGLDEDGLLASFREHAGSKAEVVPLATRSA